MFKLFKNLKPMTLILFLVFVLVATQAIAELYLPENMSKIINDGLYLDYEPAYKHLTMKKPDSFIKGDDKQIAGYDNEEIPVFEMVDGFSTFDLKSSISSLEPDVMIRIDFQDILVKDSQELFEKVLIPFQDGLEPFQGQKITENGVERDKKFTDYSPEEQAKIATAIDSLIIYESVSHDENDSLNINTFLNINKEKEEDSEDGDFQRKLLTACFMNMKHSRYGNILPIPLDKNGNRLEVNSFGEALNQSLLLYDEFYNDETERIDPFPDYEVILCNDVLGYAYKYVDGKKWINHQLGITKEKAQEMAEKYNQEHNLKPAKGGFWSNLKLSPTGKQDKANSARTYEDMLLPDGETIQSSDINFILKRGGMMLLLTLLACVCAVVASLFSAKIAANFSAIIRSKVFGKVETFSLVEFDKFSTASLITRSTNDINQIQSVFLLLLRTCLSAPITVIGGIVLSMDKSPAMTGVLIYPFPILIVASAVAMKIVFPLFDLIQTKVDRLTTIMREGLSGIRVVRAFNQQERERERFAKTNASLTKTAILVNRYVAILAPLISVVMNCTMVGVIWVASKQIANNADVNVGDMMAVVQYITQIMMALVMLATVFVMFPRASASAKRINEVLNTDLTILDKPNPVTQGIKNGTVEFKNVNFKYSKDAEHYILNNISFTAEKGKVLAIVGGTGSGKSSVINLIPRFYDISEGQVLVNGIDVRDYDQVKLRDTIGFIPQKSILFSGTIRDNMKYGKEDASDEEIWKALELAQSATFVRDKEDGLESRVEQGGNNFSGGQKQRLAIARAIVRCPEIIVFDDSFSALDFKTDRKLRTALKEVTKESATIIVAQRIGTIMDADEIIVLDNGKIVGSGKHNYLIRNCQIYRDIALSQMSEEELGL